MDKETKGIFHNENKKVKFLILNITEHSDLLPHAIHIRNSSRQNTGQYLTIKVVYIYGIGKFLSEGTA